MYEDYISIAQYVLKFCLLKSLVAWNCSNAAGGLLPNSRNFKLNFWFHCKKKISSFFFWYIYVRFFNVYYNISFISFLVPPSKAIIMDERGMEVRGSKVGPVLEGSTLILTCDIIGGKEKIKSSFFISHTYIHFFSSSFLANLWQMYIYLFLLFPLRSNLKVHSCFEFQ